MGYYINENSKGKPLGSSGKAKDLVADGGTIVDAKFQPNLVCVVDNGMFEAAGYCYNKAEFDAFNYPGDRRPKTWLTHPEAAKLSGYSD